MAGDVLVDVDTPQGRLAFLAYFAGAIDWTQPTAAVYSQVRELLQLASGADLVTIYRMTVAGDTFFTKDIEGLDARALRDYSLVTQTTGRMKELLVEHKALTVDFENPHEGDLVYSYIAPMGFRCALTVPAIADDHVFGTFSFVYRNRREFGSDEIDFLFMLGAAFARAAKCSYNAERMVEYAILDERRRLSVEVHDNIAQMIGSIKLGIESATISYAKGDEEAVGAKLDRLVRLSDEALKATREEMLTLKDDVSGEADLGEAVRECLGRFEDYWGIRTELKVIGSSSVLVLKQVVGLQLMRILHESLANVLKHAHAGRVVVTAYEQSDRFCLSVSDDGCGFDPQAVPQDHLGIGIMRERAAAVGGSVSFSSTIGEGTCVLVRIPLFVAKGGGSCDEHAGTGSVGG